MVQLVDLALVLLSLPVLAVAGYLLVLTLASGRKPAPPHGAPRRRFDIVVPAHDEEEGIGATVRSLLALDYPPGLRRVVVVADNCTDATADRAREAGAEVLVRTDAERRGKGYALALAFERSIAAGVADAVVVVDADTTVSPNLLQAFAARLDGGALAIQAEYGVRNPDASWRTRLVAIAFALFNTLRCLGRERLRCSVGLRGNGMCFAVSVLREVPHQAFSIVEDLEYGIRLGLAGHRIHYAAEAEVRGDMAVTAEASTVQRRRWEGGRGRIARKQALPLLWRGLRTPDRVLLDLGLDLATPPLAYLAALSLAGTGLSLLAAAWMGHPLCAPWVWGATLAALVIYVVRGWWLSGTGLRGLADLAYAPVYLVWKVGLALRRDKGGGAWTRTPREKRP
jgi:cellulose synthase/poly-beta-1,6-N-acetylglucosamine synthase-like glycosyltransferase